MQVHTQCRLEQQCRQEHVKKHDGPDRKPEDRLDHRVQRIGQLGLEEENRPSADQHSEDGKDHALGQAQARGERLGCADDDEERRDDRGDQNDIHGIELARRLIFGPPKTFAIAFDGRPGIRALALRGANCSRLGDDRVSFLDARELLGSYSRPYEELERLVPISGVRRRSM